MKVIKLEQNTPEWLEFRKGKSGGSGFGGIYSPTLPLKSKIVEKLEENNPLPPADKRLKVEDLAQMLTAEELAEIKADEKPKERFFEMVAERVALPISADNYTERLQGEQFTMQARGHLLEAEALQEFAKRTGKKLDESNGVWVSDYSEYAYISPDASITDPDGVIREAVEVKCLSSPKVIRAFYEQQPPDDYRPQILKYFMVNEDLQKLYFIIYTDVIPGLELQIFEIGRDEVQKDLELAKICEMKTLEKIDELVQKISAQSF